MAHGMVVIFDLLEQPQCFQFCGYFSSRRKTIHAAVLFASCVGHATVESDHGYYRQALAFTYLKVDYIVARGNFYSAGPKFHLDGFVGYYRYLPTHNRQFHHRPNLVAVPFVIGMHCNAGVTEHRLRAGCGDGYISPGPISQRVPDVV